MAKEGPPAQAEEVAVHAERSEPEAVEEASSALRMHRLWSREQGDCEVGVPAWHLVPGLSLPGREMMEPQGHGLSA